MKSKKMEFYFDSTYLITTFILGILLLARENNVPWAFMAFILVLGDSTHLLPRMHQITTGKNVPHLTGYGKMITSITMSFFYVFLWQIGLLLFSLANNQLSLVMYTLSITRVILCVLPQNKWTTEKPSYKWGIYRNIPFILQGAMVFFLYFTNREKIAVIENMYLAILLSFAFYLPVVLWVHKKPMLGMLMIPKTLCYVWIIAIGFYL